MAAVAVRSTLIAFVGMALIRTVLLPRVDLAGTSIVQAFHDSHLMQFKGT